MEKYIKVLKASPLFEGISESEILGLLNCLGAQKKVFQKNAFIFKFGKEEKCIGLVLSGKVNLLQEDFWGRRSIIDKLGASQIFGEDLVYANIKNSMLSVQATEKTEVLFIRFTNMVSPCSLLCVFHSRLIKNMLVVLAKRNANLMQKITHVCKKNTREKLMSFLSEESAKAKSSKFEICFNREELADFLALDRSAMSAELSKMQKEKIIKFQKNKFEIL